MAKRNLPDLFSVDKIGFGDCFTAPSLRHFLVLMTGWVLTVGTHTISRVIETVGAHESEHFVSAYRFFSRARWEPDVVAAVVFRLMLEMLFSGVTELLLVIDDTLSPRVGKKICGAGYQHEGAAPKGGRKIGYGVCFVVIGLAVRLPGISDRVFCLPFAARLWWPRGCKVKPRGGVYKTKPELALELIRITRSWVDPSIALRVLIDGGYSNSTVIKGRPGGVHLTGKIRKDAKLFRTVDASSLVRRGRPKKKGQPLPKPAAMFNYLSTHWDAVWMRLYGKETVIVVHRFQAIWYRGGGNQALSLVLIRDPAGEFPDTVLFDTDTKATDEQIVDRFAHRWSIEITNRETKHLLGSADPHCRSEKAVVRSTLMAFWSYSLVVLWFVGQFRLGKELVLSRTPWYFRKKNITFSDMLASARRSHLAPRISVDYGREQDRPKFNNPRLPRRAECYERAKL